VSGSKPEIKLAESDVSDSEWSCQPLNPVAIAKWTYYTTRLFRLLVP
jgi:hypothetical protein